MKGFRLAPAVLAGLLLATASHGARADTALTCPDRLEGASASAGWAASAKPPQDGNGTAAWTLFDGKPEEQASLAPDRDSGRAQTFVLVAGREAWVQCRVGRAPLFERRLPVGLKSCTVPYQAARGQPPRFGRTMTCR